MGARGDASKFSKLANLERLEIPQNGFKWDSDSLSGLSKLKYLDISRSTCDPKNGHNLYEPSSITCVLPGGIKKMKNLETLYATESQFKGSISNDFFSKLEKLVELKIHRNFFDGRLPDLSNLKRLKTLSIGGNNFK